MEKIYLALRKQKTACFHVSVVRLRALGLLLLLLLLVSLLLLLLVSLLLLIRVFEIIEQKGKEARSSSRILKREHLTSLHCTSLH